MSWVETFNNVKMATLPKLLYRFSIMECPRWLSGKEPTCQRKRHRLTPAQGRPSKKEMTTRSSVLPGK